MSVTGSVDMNVDTDIGFGFCYDYEYETEEIKQTSKIILEKRIESSRFCFRTKEGAYIMHIRRGADIGR